MKAAVYHGARDIRIEDVAEPVPAAGQVLVEVSRNGICGSDLHTYVGSTTGSAALHIPGVVLGHEFAGVVRAVGPGVDDVAIGSAVAVAPLDACGTCWACQHAWPNLCRHMAVYGGLRKPLHGGLAPLAAVARNAVYTVPDGVDVTHAALAEPTAVAVHAVRRAPNTFGASALVLGAGPIGLVILRCLIAGGAAPIIVSETSAARRKLAERFGATAVVDPAQTRLLTAVRDLAPHGVDLVFDTTAANAALAAGIVALRPRGTLVNVAAWPESASIHMGQAAAREITMTYSVAYEPAVDFPIALQLLASGAIEASSMITGEISLDRLVDDGLEELLHHNDRHIKILIDPSA